MKHRRHFHFQSNHLDFSTPDSIFYIHGASTLVAKGNISAGLSNADGVITVSRAAGGRALLPGNVELLGEGNGGIVVGQLAGSIGVLAGQRNAVVDVEDAGGAAGRPDGGGGLDGVLLGVYLAVGEGAAAVGSHAGGGLDEVLVIFGTFGFLEC